MSIKLSIAAAVYNLDEDLLRAHIEGIAAQLNDETELLLIDDCSKNNSGEVCAEYADKASNIRYIRMEENGGLSAVRNRSIEEAAGEWIFFTDGDDLLSAHAVETALKFCESDADIIIHERLKFVEELPADEPCKVSGLIRLPEGAGKTISVSCLCLDPNICGVYGLSAKAFYHAAWGALYRKEFLVKNNLLFPVGQKKAQDAVFNTETYYHAEKIDYLPYVMYFYRGNPQGITRRYSKDLPAIYEKLLGLLYADKERFYAGDADVDSRYRNHRVVACAIDNMRLNIFHKDNPKPKAQRKAEFLELISQEPYKSAIDGFNAKAYNRYEWLLIVKLMRKKRFALLDMFVGNDKAFNICCGIYKRIARIFG